MKRSILFVFAAVLFVWACNSNSGSETPKPGANGVALPKEVADLYAALTSNPTNNNLRLKLAYALDSIGQPALAIKQMDTLVAKDTASEMLWVNRASIAEDAKDTVKALESYSRALHINESAGTLLKLANLYAESKNPRALLICGRVKNMAQGKEVDANSDFIAGVYYSRTGNRPAALQKFDDAIAGNYTFMEAYIEKGMVYFDNKQYPEALKVFQFAGTINHLYADAYYYQARCYEMMAKKDSAVLRFKQSLSLDKGLTEAHAGLKRLGAE